MKFPVYMKRIFNKKLENIGNLNNTFKPTLIQIFSRIQYNALVLHIHLYGREIYTLKKNTKKIDIP